MLERLAQLLDFEVPAVIHVEARKGLLHLGRHGRRCDGPRSWIRVRVFGDLGAPALALDAQPPVALLEALPDEPVWPAKVKPRHVLAHVDDDDRVEEPREDQTHRDADGGRDAGPKDNADRVDHERSLGLDRHPGDVVRRQRRRRWQQEQEHDELEGEAVDQDHHRLGACEARHPPRRDACAERMVKHACEEQALPHPVDVLVPALGEQRSIRLGLSLLPTLQASRLGAAAKGS